MGAVVAVTREEPSAAELRQRAAGCRDGRVACRMLAIAHVLDGRLILPGFRGSSALCVDYDGGGLIVGGSGLPFHLMVHDRLLSHAGLPR